MKARGVMFVGMFLAAALSPLGSTMIAVALPSIGAELHVSTAALTGWLVASYLIAGIAAMSPCGKLGDVIGHRRALLIGMSIYAAGSTLGFVMGTLPALTFARISMAVGGALVVPATMAILRRGVSAEKRPRTFGYLGSVMGTAAAVGPLVGGELVAHFGWRAVFVANLPVLVIAFALIHFASARLPGPVPPAERTPFDVVGSVLVALALAVLVGANHVKGPLAPWAIAVGAALAVAFLVWERRSPSPVVDLGLFARREFAAGNAVVALQNLAMYALLFQLPIYFELIRGVHRGTTGRFIIGMMVAMVVCAPLGGRLSEWLGARAVAFVGCLLSLAGMFALGNFAHLVGPADALPGLILVGAGLGLATAPSQSTAMNAVDPARAGMAGGALSTSRYVGGVIGIAILGTLLEARAGAAAHRNAAICYEVALALASLAALMLPGRLAHAIDGDEPAAPPLGAAIERS